MRTWLWIILVVSPLVHAEHSPDSSTPKPVTSVTESTYELKLRQAEEEIYQQFQENYCNTNFFNTAGVATWMFKLAELNGVTSSLFDRKLEDMEKKLGIETNPMLGIMPRGKAICREMYFPEVDEIFHKFYGDRNTMTFEDRTKQCESFNDKHNLVKRNQAREKLELRDRIKSYRNFVEIAFNVTLPNDEDAAKEQFKKLTGMDLPEFPKDASLDEELKNSAKAILRIGEAKLEEQYARRLHSMRNPATGVIPKLLRQRIDFVYNDHKDRMK